MKITINISCAGFYCYKHNKTNLEKFSRAFNCIEVSPLKFPHEEWCEFTFICHNEANVKYLGESSRQNIQGKY